ncbi:hypothetical protein D9611_007421 [Ephemerocybe angulata]|uniref:Telomere-associated protein Rif1 N-terminal domain-containing protein n=1 Tax=Ephemerocybe angulata TaxID=980116 RepID=A0A8H5CF71_9AGAR|nr:hypothetical protein D9611_007421 [Tulosesus angulatus]
MALLTPPHSSTKENVSKFTFALAVNVDVPKMQASTSTAASATPSSASRNVVWSPDNTYHPLITPGRTPPSTATTNARFKERPRSILKRRRSPPPLPLTDSTNAPQPSTSTSPPADVTSLQDLPPDLDQQFRMREATPEPSDPMTNLTYLDYPVSLILKDDAEPRELIEGYSILAARLRTSVAYKTDADASWPLFQPLRKRGEDFVQCVIRDLGRALVDPIKTLACPSSIEEENAMKEWQDADDGEDAKAGLPSPLSSPKKPKRKGMTAAQVKYARDLCTISHSVMKLLCIMFSVPATYSVFEVKQLKSMMNATLAIPLAERLPTPNARKTCALAILVLQCQRLPETVVAVFRDRIALALKRGITGELGKEGKKGSANDGLRAIHDLSIYQPRTYIPAFTSVMFLRCILDNLLAPTLALRLQACHALGGVAYALAGLPPSSHHVHASNAVLEFVTTPAPPSPSKNKASPSLAPRDSAIVRTLRTTMSTPDPTHVAQSPIWSISVIASLVVLLGSRICTSKKACTSLLGVLKLASNKKTSIRGLFSIAWRTLTWAWFQPDYDTLEDDGEDEKTDGESGESAKRSVQNDTKLKTREAFFVLLNEVMQGQTALHNVAAFVSCRAPASVHPDDNLRRGLTILQSMVFGGNAESVNDAMAILTNLLNPTKSAFPPQPTHRILARGLFSSHPTTGLLAVDLAAGVNVANSSMAAVRPLFDGLLNISDVRPLTRAELRKEWVWTRVCKLWRSITTTLQVDEEAEIPEDLLRAWEAIVVAGLGRGEEEESGDASSEADFMEKVMEVLVGILEDKSLDFRLREDAPAAGTSKIPFPSSDASSSSSSVASLGKHTKHELKFKVVRALCSTVEAVASKEQLAGKPLQNLFACLVNPKNVAEWTTPRSVEPAPRTPLPRKRQRMSSLSLWNAISSGSGGAPGKDVLGPICGYTSLVTSVMSIADGEAAKGMVKAFWGLETLADGQKSIVGSWDADVKSSVYRTSVNVWRKNEGCWEGAAALLAVPFASAGAAGVGGKAVWTLSAEESSTKWKELCEYATGKALDYGVDAVAVVDAVAEIVVEAKEEMVLGSSSRERSSSPLCGTPRSGVSSVSGACSSTVAAALIQVSDLLLDNIDITEARDVPASLVSLVNETMRATYPMSTRNVSPATWLVQTLTRTVEQCPESFVGGLIEALSGGLAVWLSDESEVWSEDALDYTFVPLYQHLLLRIQTLPKDLGFLDAVSPLLESVFSGARAMPEAVMGSFKETFDTFWSMSPYSKMDEPAGGWPPRVRRCLGLDAINHVEETATEAPITLLAASPIIVPATPKRVVPGRKHDIGVSGVPRTPMANMNGFAHIPSPHRPRKESVDSSAPFPLPMVSPVSPVRRRRRTNSTNLSAGSMGLGMLFGSGLGSGSARGLGVGLAPGLDVMESPSKRRRVSAVDEGARDGEERVRGKGKENADANASLGSPVRRGRGQASPVRLGRPAAPLFEVVSVAERIVAASASAGAAAVVQGGSEEGKKRRRKMKERMGAKKGGVRWDVSPAESVASNCSRGSGGSTSSDDERWIADALIPFPSVEVGGGQQAGEGEEDVEMVVVKKRKRTLVMDAVLLPPVGTANAQGASRRRKLEHASATADVVGAVATTSELRTPPPPAKRVVSAPELECSKRKRKRSASIVIGPYPVAVDVEGDNPFDADVATPLPALKLPGLPSPTASAAAEEEEEEEEEVSGEIVELPSSDDDPRYGQVTPHHIVSPALAQKTGKVYVSKMKRSASADSVLQAGSGSGLHVSFKDVVGSDDDDSMMGEPGSSPSKKVAERRMLRRQSSLGGGEMKRLGQLNPVFSW